MARIIVGCCGFPVSRDRYYETFRAVEIQQTFYQPPMIETAAKWREGAPEGFTFAMKAWQLITHEATSPTYRRLKIDIPSREKKNYGSFKPTEQVFEAWETTRLFARKLGAKLIVFQCPASFKPRSPNKKNMLTFFKSIDRKALHCVWEPRGAWKEEEIRELCEELDLIHCVDPLKDEPVYGRIRYFRLHGKTGYRSRYEIRDLRAVLEMCRGETYCFFNNMYMYDDAVKFLRLIENNGAQGGSGGLS